MLLLTLDEPSATYATLSNMLFKAVDVHPFVIVLDYHPVKVRSGLECVVLSCIAASSCIHQPWQ